MRILHTADLHLGQVIYQSYVRQDEHEAFFRQLREWCEEYRPDVLVVSGDVFDMAQPGADVKKYFNQKMAELIASCKEMKIVVTAGNHDSASRLEADSVVWNMAGLTMVGHAPTTDVGELPDGWQERFIVEVEEKGYVVAMPFMSNNRRDAIQSVLDKVAERNEEGLPVVMMGHVAVSGGDFSGHGEIGMIKTQGLDEMGSGYDYLALGHIHRPQTLGYDIADEMGDGESQYQGPVARYSGSALHVSCDEKYPHTVSLVDIERHGGEVKLKRLRIEELRHFYELPPTGEAAIKDRKELEETVNRFCETHERGYIRLRIDHGAPLGENYVNWIYDTLKERTADEVRYNPQVIWENEPQETAEKERPRLELAEIQGMISPWGFIEKTIDDYEEFTLEELKADFQEIAEAIRKVGEADPEEDKRAGKSE